MENTNCDFSRGHGLLGTNVKLGDLVTLKDNCFDSNRLAIVVSIARWDPGYVYIAFIDVINSGFRILFYCVIGSVVLSWVAPENNHPLLQIVEEISAGVLDPIRKFLPPMGGLDFTPIIGLLILNLINSSFIQIIRSLL